MYRRHYLDLMFFWSLGLYSSITFEFDFLSDVAGHVLTVLSIFFGFYMTSAATICSSSLYSKLHKEMDSRQEPRKIRLSQTLKNYFKFGFNSLLLGIFFFLIALLIKSDDFDVFFSLHDRKNIFRYFYNAVLGAHITLCLAFSFIQTKLFIVSFMNIAYCEEKKQ